MSLFCKLNDLHNESDVEQKLIWPLLTTAQPTGLSYAPAEIYTKADIRFLKIDKGKAEKLYRPDYLIVISGFPLVVVEAKHPDEDLAEALREARLYAAVLNAQHPTGVNPCLRVVACNGRRLISSPADSEALDFAIDFQDIQLGSQRFHELLALLSRSPFQERADVLRNQLRPAGFWKPTHLLGGKSARNEEVGYNDFGARLAIDFLHLFNPRSRSERAAVVRNAYVPSRRREHYADEIDRVIRTAIPSPILPGSTLIEDTSNPSELLRLLGRGKDLQNRLFLLVGPVGAGKSTFVDYLRELKLTEQIRNGTVWVNVDMNDAPIVRDEMEKWVVEEIIRGLRHTRSDLDFDAYSVLQKVFSVELDALKRGPLAMIPVDSTKYNEAIADELRKHLADTAGHAKALARYLCADHRVLVLVLDNCDKGDLNEQLATFQIVRWIQSRLKCLVFLPIRDVTYHTYKDRPPLDTVIKEFVFRIESPPFAEVLRKRITLALTELTAADKDGETYEYSLESGMRVVYPATELGLYLACIYRSLYEHDHLLRRMLVGLAGKNIRRAMEIFLDFCKSGHIGHKEYLKIRAFRGNYALPYHVVTRVLLRLNRRFYDGATSHVKNLFQCDPADPLPHHFVRFAILRWLFRRFRQRGPTNIKGYHLSQTLIAELVPFGFDAERIRSEVQFLVKSMCVFTEHQRTEDLTDSDLICLSHAGFAHLSMVGNFDYLAACSEDTWIEDRKLAEIIAERIGQHGIWFHFARETTRNNALDFVDYLLKQSKKIVCKPTHYLELPGDDTPGEIENIRWKVAKGVQHEREKEKWPEVDGKFEIGKSYEGTVDGISAYGLFVALDGGPTGMLHISKWPKRLPLSSVARGDRLRVRLLAIDRTRKRLSLAFDGNL